MLESAAYCELSLSARRVLDRIEIELAKHGGVENGRLPVTYDDFNDTAFTDMPSRPRSVRRSLLASSKSQKPAGPATRTGVGRITFA
jgi:hypothetical protein